MSLICPNLCFIFIKGKSLLIICPNNFFQYFSVKFTSFGNSGNQPVYICPAMFIQLDSDCFWFMAQD